MLHTITSSSFITNRARKYKLVIQLSVAAYTPKISLKMWKLQRESTSEHAGMI
jgi:hypothetical protein